MVIEIGFFAGEKLVHHGGPRGTRPVNGEPSVITRRTR